MDTLDGPWLGQTDKNSLVFRREKSSNPTCHGLLVVQSYSPNPPLPCASTATELICMIRYQMATKVNHEQLWATHQ